MHELNWFRNATFLNRLKSAPGLTPQASASQVKFQADECCPDTSNPTFDISLEEIESEIAEQFHLRVILEEACLVTGATGAAIALARGKEMICCATAGADAPDLGVCLDLHHGLSGTCIRTQQLQQCADTETDPRVDRQVCRDLGVRSLAVLPLLEGSELLGVFEVLSSRPNAFGQDELDSLQDLGKRILPARRQDAEVSVKMPLERAANFKEVAPAAQNHVAKSLRRQRRPENQAILTTLLGVLVVAVALLLGMVAGWRFGWQRATLQIRNDSVMHRSSTQSRIGRPDETLPSAEIPCSSTVSHVSENTADQVTKPRESRAGR